MNLDIKNVEDIDSTISEAVDLHNGYKQMNESLDQLEDIIDIVDGARRLNEVKRSRVKTKLSKLASRL